MDKVIIHNVETGEIIERDPTVEELAQWAENEKASNDRRSEINAKEQEKAALLEKLGITEAEAKLLLA